MQNPVDTAATRVARHLWADLERLCRYLLRPPLAYDRLTLRPDGSVALRLPRVLRDGTRALLFTPIDFIARLVPLIPRPRIHLLRYHGVLAPAAAWRGEVVALAEPPDDDARHSPGPRQPGRRQRSALSWSELLRWTFGLEVLVCARCGGPRPLVAMIQDPATARRILRHLGLPASAPPIAPARPPPQVDLDFEPAP